MSISESESEILKALKKRREELRRLYYENGTSHYDSGKVAGMDESIEIVLEILSK